MQFFSFMLYRRLQSWFGCIRSWVDLVFIGQQHQMSFFMNWTCLFFVFICNFDRQSYHDSDESYNWDLGIWIRIYSFLEKRMDAGFEHCEIWILEFVALAHGLVHLTCTWVEKNSWEWSMCWYLLWLGFLTYFIILAAHSSCHWEYTRCKWCYLRPWETSWEVLYFISMLFSTCALFRSTLLVLPENLKE